MKIFKLKRNESGIALILVLGILAVLAILATTFAFNSRLEQKAAKNYMFAIMAYDVAKAGIEHSIASMKIYALEQAHMVYTDNWYYTSSSEPSFDEYNGNTDDNVTGVVDFGGGMIGTYNLKIVDTASQICVNHGETTGRLNEILEELGVGAGQGTNIINYRNSLPDDLFLTKEQVKETNSTVLGNYSNFDDFIAVNGYVNDKVCLASEGFSGLSYHDSPPSGWTVRSGIHWEIEYGELSQGDTTTGGDIILSYDHTQVDNFSALFKVKIVSGTGTNWAGFQFRKDAEGHDHETSGYTVRLYENGAIDLCRATGGGEVIMDDELAGTISDTDVFHTIKVTANGNQFNVSVDGTAYLSDSNSTYTNGYMSFITNDDVHAHFDSFEVTTSLSPICVNTASKDVLVAVLKGLDDDGTGINEITQANAETVADAIITYRSTPGNEIKSWDDFNNIIDGSLGDATKETIIKDNANLNTGINLSEYSVPFCFHGSGFLEIECLAKVGRDFNSDGTLEDSDDGIYAEKRIKTIIKVFNIWYVNTQEDFDSGATTTNSDTRAYPGSIQIAAQNMWIEAENYTTDGNADNAAAPITPHPSNASNDCTVQNSDNVQVPAVAPDNYLEWDNIGISDIGDYVPSSPTALETCYLLERTYWDNESATIQLSYDSGNNYGGVISPGVAAGNFEWSASGAGTNFTTKNHDIRITAVDLTADALAAASAIYALEPDAFLVTLDNTYVPLAADIADGSYDDPNYYSTITFESGNSPTIDIPAGDKWGAILFTEGGTGTVRVKTNSSTDPASGAYTNGDEIVAAHDDDNAIWLQIELDYGGAAGARETPYVDDILVTYVPVSRILYWAEW